MKPSARLIRLALANRFPRWTRRGWTYLTSLDEPGAPCRKPWTPAGHLACWLAVLVVSATTGLVSANVLIDLAFAGIHLV